MIYLMMKTVHVVAVVTFVGGLLMLSVGVGSRTSPCIARCGAGIAR